MSEKNHNPLPSTPEETVDLVLAIISEALRQAAGNPLTALSMITASIGELKGRFDATPSFSPPSLRTEMVGIA